MTLSSNNFISPWDQTNLVFNSIEKVKYCFLLSLMWMFPESNETNHSFHLQNSGILQIRINQREDPMKTNFDIFQIQKWISQTVRAQKVGEKNGVIYLVSFFPSWVLVLKLPKIVHFCKFVLTSARNLNLLKQFIYIHLKNVIMLFQKIVFYRGMNNSSRDVED